MEAWMAQVVETWQINNRVNLYLVDAIPPEALTSVLPSPPDRFSRLSDLARVISSWRDLHGTDRSGAQVG